MKSDRACTDCGRPARPGGLQCARCYQKRYRATEEGRKRHNAAIYAYIRRNPAKRRQWVNTWKQRVGISVPDLQLLRAAIKRLDAATERSGVRGPDEYGGDDGLEG